MSIESPPAEDKYADYRPQALTHPFPELGWAMVARGILTAVFAFPILASFAAALREGRYDGAATLVGLGLLFITWGGRTASLGAAIALRFKVKPSAPSDLADRLDPHTNQAVSYGKRAYKIENLRFLFLRKELPDESGADLVDEILSVLGRAKEPMHPAKRALIIDVLRGAAASIGLLLAFIFAFGFVQFDPAMRGQASIMNLVFLVAFIMVSRNWGLTKEAWTERHALSISRVLQQAGSIFLVAVLLPVILGMLGPVTALFARTEISSPFGLLLVVMVLGSLVTALVLAVPVIQSRAPVYHGPAVLAISDGPTVEARGRLLPGDLLHAFARYIGSSRRLSLDDRVYSFLDPQRQPGENASYAEFIAESAPLIRKDLLITGRLRRILVASYATGELLLAGAAVLLFLTASDVLDAAHRVAALLRIADLNGLLVLAAHPVVSLALLLAVVCRFGVLLREIGVRFLGEVIFQSYMIVISISSTVMAGRNETEVSQGEGAHLFDSGRTSLLRIRIQSAFVHTATMISAGVAGDSLAEPRYLIGAEREDRIMQSLADEAYRYIKERTDIATTRVRSQSVEMRDAPNLLVDSGSGSQLMDEARRAALSNYNKTEQFLTDRRGFPPPEGDEPS